MYLNQLMVDVKSVETNLKKEMVCALHLTVIPCKNMQLTNELQNWI